MQYPQTQFQQNAFQSSTFQQSSSQQNTFQQKKYQEQPSYPQNDAELHSNTQTTVKQAQSGKYF